MRTPSKVANLLAAAVIISIMSLSHDVSGSSMPGGGGKKLVRIGLKKVDRRHNHHNDESSQDIGTKKYHIRKNLEEDIIHSEGLNIDVYLDSLSNPYEEYLGEISIGTPPQKLLVKFDTTSSTTWVNTVANVTVASNSMGYIPDMSSTYKKIIDDMYPNPPPLDLADIQFIGGGSDNIAVGDDLVVKDQKFFETSWVNQVFGSPKSKAAGALGLAFNEINGTTDTVPIWETMIQQGLIDEPIISFSFNRSTNEGQIVFGGVDPPDSISNYTKVPLTKKGNYWQFNMTDIGLASNQSSFESLLESSNYNYSAMIGSATPYIAGPKSSIALINKAIGATVDNLLDPERKYFKSCEDADFLHQPNVSFFFGGKYFHITWKEYVLKINGKCISRFVSVDQVLSGLTADERQGLWLLGSPFWSIISIFIEAATTVTFGALGGFCACS